jgi:hypothetical protein
VEDLDLGEVEFRHILWACAHFRLTYCTPDYLQDFIAQRLDAVAPELAAKVRRYSPAQIDALCRLIMARQRGELAP